MLNFIISLIVGAVAGWLAGIIMKCPGSWLRNIILGIVGGVVGGFVAGLIGLAASNIIGRLLISVLGACIVLAVMGWITKKK